MKKTLIRAGFFSELAHGRPDGGSLRAALRSAAGPDDARFVAYLRAGHTLVTAFGPVFDILAPGMIIGTMAYLTDGIFAWPSDLAHYVEKHHVAPPEALLEHARANGFTVPAVDTSTVGL